MRFVYKETYDRTSKADIMRVIISLLSLWVLCSASRDSRTIPLSVNDVRQGIETRKGHDAKMAIDGDLSTFSLAEGNESWWMIDLKKTYQISQVIITASHDAENAKYLHSFSILLEDENSKRDFCYAYTSTESLAPSETRSFPCEAHNFQTRFIKITTDESNEQNKLVLAEVTITSGLPPSKILLSGDEITLVKASQYETTKETKLAIDKNVMTFSLAVSNSAKDHAWLQVELADNYDVGEVTLTASHDMDYAKTLQNFVIWLLKSDKSPMTCKKYMSEMSLAPRETRPFRCQDRQVHTKFVRIERIGGSYKPNELAIAEVKVKTRSSPFTITPNSEFRIEIPLAGNLATQSDTVWLHGGNLATDGDVNTFAVAKPLLTFPDIKHELWWQVDLEGYYQVGRVILTASVDKEYTHCLHNFAILLINENNEMHFCNGYKSSGHFYPLPTRSFVCENDIFLARYIRIQRHGSISDTLALAEVRAFTGFSRRM